MCIIISKPAGKTIDPTIYKDCFWRHDDGAGFCYVDQEKNELITRKGFFKDEELIEAIKPVEHLEMLIHFRGASAGMQINASQCHPFAFYTGIEEGQKAVEGHYHWAVVHNGRLDWRHDDKHSDTSCFVHDLLMDLLNENPTLLESESGVRLMEKLVGTYYCRHTKKQVGNRIVIMRWDTVAKKSAIFYINKATGNEEEGVWFSNPSWKGIVEVEDYGDVWNGEGGFNQYYREAMRAQNAANAATQGYKDVYKDREKFAKPDVNGWKWLYARDRWLNVITNVEAFELATRERPYQAMQYTESNRKDYFAYLATNQPTPDPKIVVIDKPKVEVIVPRDPGVIDLLDHLTKEEISSLCHEAALFAKRCGQKTIFKKMNASDKIAYLREGCRALLEGFSAMDDAFADHYILRAIKAGTFRMDLIAAERRELEEERLRNMDKVSSENLTD